LSDREASFLEPFGDSGQPEVQSHAEQAHFHASQVAQPEFGSAAESVSPEADATAPEATTQAASDAVSRETKLAKTRAAKMSELFRHKKYLILGEIHLGNDEQFQTPFGNRGRHGFVLSEQTTGKKIVVGETMLRNAASMYDAVVGLPPEKPKRHRRTKAQKAAEDAQKAAIAAENQARILARFEEQQSAKAEQATVAAQGPEAEQAAEMDQRISV
jgi:hypothetical protein